MNDEAYMILALNEAKRAFQKEEVPVGAVLVDSRGEILSKGHNQPISLSDPTSHAEIIALRMACEKISNYRLLNTTLYVTIEPCIMCMGAIIHARVERVVFGAEDPKWGGAGSQYDFAGDGKFNHVPEISGGIYEKECRELIQSFFQARRKSVASNNIMS